MTLKHWNNRYRWFPTLVFLGVVINTSAAPAQLESWDDRTWRLAYHSDDERQGTATWILDGETLSKWSEQVMITFPGKGLRFNPEILKTRLHRRCPNLVWHRLKGSLSFVGLYEWRVTGCASLPDEHVIFRIFGAKMLSAEWKMYKVAYKAKVAQLPPDKKSYWMERLLQLTRSDVENLWKESERLDPRAPYKKNPPEKFDTELNTPGVIINLKETERGKRGDVTYVEYNLEVSGLPQSKQYGLWSTPRLKAESPNAPRLICPISTTDGNVIECEAANGKRTALSAMKLRHSHLVRGQAIRVAVFSTDHEVYAYAKQIPFPIESQEGQCRMTIEAITPKVYRVFLSGFPEGESVEVKGKIGINRLKERFVAQASPRRDGVQQTIELIPKVAGGGIGKGGSAKVEVKAESCSLSVAYKWGSKAKVQ